ncbi:uncharacterized protein LOC100381631 [Zea mays]|uniref:YTH domain-containing family protein n=1 Tax=Zea mays TaxID=4577 RepID=C0HHM5_MAIZE|nr:uncharacterized protein LOC100381631 [Zea mays]ACN26528.1 unknown [Zea mays]ONM14089.1 evolutionarily conserved C-terminal region 10 [Zea mays]|eukprot:NP_001167919.1 uncharacterized protein LOC100381631 [Zea mays]
MVPSEPQTVVENKHSTSVGAEELLLTKDESTSTTVVQGAGSLMSPKGVQEEASFMGKGKGGEQQLGYQPNVYVSQPHTPFSGGYSNHLDQWEGYPYAVSAEGLDAAYPVTYGAYSPLSAIGDSHTYFSLLCPLSRPCYQPPASPNMRYSSPGTGISQFYPMHQYYSPDEVHYSVTPSFYQPFGSFNGVPMQPSSFPGFFGQGNIPLTSRMHQESMSNSGSHKAFQQGGKFGGSTQSWSTASCKFGTFKDEKCSPDFLNEQCRGPRATKTRKEVGSSSTEDKNKNVLPIADSDKYNHPGFVTEYKDARFYVIKSYTEDHIHKSIKYNVWASTPRGNRKLNAGYHEAKAKEDHCPIFLFFSVNSSGHFCGVAEMIGPVNFDKSVDYWQNERWNGQFPVKWHIVKDVPNNIVRHIILENNENKRVTNSRDTQEVKLKQGLQMLAIFKNHEAQTNILEDFDFYEQREKAMLDDRQQQKPECSDTGKQVQASAPVDIVTGMSDAFAQAVQLEKTNDKENKPRIEDADAADNAPAAPVKIEEDMLKTAEVGGLLKESG